MCHTTTTRVALLGFLALGTLAPRLPGQALPKPDWRRIGNSAIDLSLAGVGTGPIVRVWYSEDGVRLNARTSSGRVFQTEDLETWVPAASTIPAADDDEVPVPVRPEANSRVRAHGRSLARLYAMGRFVYRSEDGGRHWANLTRYRDQSLIGRGLMDFAVSPNDPDEIVVAAQSGVWRSADGGLSWSSLNQSLPNLPLRRLIGFPADTRGLRIAIDQPGGTVACEWAPGEKQAWREVTDDALARESNLKRALTESLRSRITAVAAAGDFLYAGSADGQLWASSDRGRSWRRNPDQAAAPVEQIFTDPRDPRMALAALGARFPDAPPGAKSPHVIRILNGGALWDDLTANLPDSAVNGVTADRATGAVYLATDRGLYMAFQELVSAAPAAPWIPIGEGLPAAAVVDVKLDPAGNQLYVALEGFGVYAAPALHRFRDVRAVHAADFGLRPAAPGALLTVLGANVRTAQSGSMTVPVLASSDGKSEIQVPFEARGTSLALALESSAGALTLGLPLRSASPAIFVDRDGSPMLLDADSGVMLDAMTPARSNSRLQLLAGGLGRVRPEWPTGVPAPLDHPPQVAGVVKAYLDRVPVEVTRAHLAPGYVGFYLVEIQLPKLVNYGPAELYIEVDDQPSNRVRVYIEP
jgi:uncharacterized protein (TIGR03437 family)